MALEEGIAYYDTLLQEEQARLTASIRLLLHQTFILERKFDRRSGRLSITRISGTATSIWNSSAVILLSAGLRSWKIPRQESSISRAGAQDGG